MENMTSAQLAQLLYVAYYGRPADATGLTFWAEQIDAVGVEGVAADFGASAEFEARFGDLTNEELVQNLYQQLFGRDGEQAGVDYWVNLLENGTPLAQIALEIANGAQNDDVTAINNKVAVAQKFTDLAGDEYSGDEAANTARDFLLTVDAAADVDAVDVQAAVNSLVPGQTFTLTAATDDVLIGTSGNDTFEGDATTYEDTDRIVDSSTKDNDVLNLTETVAVNPDVVNVENINVNLNSLSALAVDASKISGAKVLTVTRGDVTVGGSTLNGNKTVQVNNADSAGVAKIVAGAGTTTVDINAAATDKAGLVVDASTATGNVNVDGAATIMANASTGTVAVDAVTNTTAAETGKATSITANSAATVTTHADLTGSVEINAAKASTITVNDAQGGATVTGATTSTADSTITVAGIDDTGATIVTGTGSATAAEKQVTVDLSGTAQTTDKASVAAAGVVALDAGKTANSVDALTLSGNGAAVTYNLSVSNGAVTSITKAGQNSVTVAGNESLFSGVAVSGLDVLDLNAGTAGTIDGSKWTSVGTVDLGFDNAGNAITVSDAATYSVTANQTTGLNFDYTTAAKNLTIVAGDVNGASNTAVGTLSIAGTLDAAAGATEEGTVSIVANEANLTVGTATTIGAKQTLNVSGDEDVNLGTVTAKDVNASASTGKITLTATTGVTDTVVTGSGDDNLTANGADVHNFAAGAGADTITITNTQATSQFDGGAGNDTVNMNTAGVAYVVVGGEGDDNFKTGVDIDAVVVGGAGSDTLTVTGGTLDLADNANFAFSSIEKVDLTSAGGATTISAAQLANNSTFAITADGDQLNVEVDPLGNNVGGTLNASGITIASGSTATLNYVGSSKNDIITGGVENEQFTMTAGDDSIDGGTKAGDADQFTAAIVADTGTAVATVINLSGSDVSSTEVLSKTGYRTAGDSAATAGTAQSLFNDTTATNDASVTSLTGIEKVVGTTGKDYIVAASTSTTIDGGQGDDFIKLGSGADTVIFGAAATNGSDTIASFQAGAGGDILNVSGLATLTGATGNFFEASTATAATTVGSYKSFAVTDAAASDWADVATVIGASVDESGAGSEKSVFAIDNGTDTRVYLYQNDGNDNAVQAAELTLVGTLSGVDAAGLAAGNFAFA